MAIHGAPDTRRVVQAVLERHGTTYASEAEIRIRRNTPAPLFQLLCLSLLISARISAGVAVAAARALFEAGLTTAEHMAEATWEERTCVLNRSGYARYDESTSRFLGSTAELLLERYEGDLRRVRAEADGDPDELRARLVECNGVGDVGANVFIREVQAVWTEFDPFADDRTLDAAVDLGLPRSADDLRDTVDDAETFARLAAALVRSGLAGDGTTILDEAGQR